MNKRKDSNKATGRNYTYDDKYESSATQIKNRESRNLARKHALESVAKTHGLDAAKKALKGKDIDHIKSLKGGGSRTAKSNLRVRSIHANRGDKTY